MACDFSGEVAIVTGSTSGIGEDAVINFAKCGAQVLVTGRSEGRGEESSQFENFPNQPFSTFESKLRVMLMNRATIQKYFPNRI